MKICTTRVSTVWGMICLGLLSSLLVTPSALSQENVRTMSRNSPYEAVVRIADHEDQPYRSFFQIVFATKKNYQSMCSIAVDSVTIQRPRPATFGPSMGLIKLVTKPDQFAPCAEAIGPHLGSIQLAYGHDLPGIAPGFYRLVIDSYVMGFLRISQNNAELISGDQLPQ